MMRPLRSSSESVAEVKGANSTYNPLNEFFFSKNKFTLRTVNELAILVNFGTMFPPLAVIICIAMSSYTLFSQLTIGRFIVNTKVQRGVN